MDIAELLRRAMKRNGWSERQNEIQQDVNRGIDPKALYQLRPAEYKTDADKIAASYLIPLFNEYFLPKSNTYHNRNVLDKTD